ncbi:MAG TPA: radical SAM family heme chaperone HemW [Nitrospira sp.]|nr:radical SAM family heme chaperone HemW [Nitrospira sp.]
MATQLHRDIGLYVHIPFCKQRCHFCAFYLEVARPERMRSFRTALAQEITLYRQDGLVGHRALRSIYFGGGTPTALPTAHLVSLLQLIRRTWPTESSVEITLEAHPSTVSRSDLNILADAGFNRISFGAESMNENDFLRIGRPGRVQDTEAAVQAARAAGFSNINLDLMYGLPSQSLASWTETVQSLLALEPTHVSCYALTIEDGTKLAEDIARNLVPRPDETLQIDMESAAESMLKESGFDRYEISNYAKPGFSCRHNLLYWTDGDYLGLGPSAQSYVNGIRFGTVPDLTAYTESLNTGCLPIAERIALSDTEQQRDALVFGLRRMEGVPRHLIRPDMPQHQALVQLSRHGMIECTDDHIRLTAQGRRFADSVAQELY